MSLVLAVMVVLLKKKTLFGHAMLAASIILFAITNPSWEILWSSITKTITEPGTWSMLITLYLVMCLEYMLRTSGLLKDFTASSRKLFRSDRAILGFMPAFLGFLPSLGGAIFSAPLVKEAARNYSLSPERLAAINYWFRHIWEYSNPIFPALLLASQLTRIPTSTLISHQLILSAAAAVIGILFLLTGKAYRRPPQEENCQSDDDILTKKALRSILLGAGPIMLNIFLVIFFDMNTALALGLVIIIMTFILKYNPRNILKMLSSSFDKGMLWGVLNIILFQQILENTGSIREIVSVFEGSSIPAAVIIGLTAFTIGLLTGSTQGFVAVAFPLAYALGPGNLDLIALGYVTGTFGAMTSPAHLCLIVTLEYFKADFIKTLLPIILMGLILILFTIGYITLF